MRRANLQIRLILSRTEPRSTHSSGSGATVENLHFGVPVPPTYFGVVISSIISPFCMREIIVT